jgi:SAM-dependent methyltransferase
MSAGASHLEGASVFARCYGRRADHYARFAEPRLEPVAAGVVRRAALSGNERLLDLATGTGTAARLAARLGAEVAGIDVSPGMVAVARRLSPPGVHFDVADAARLPFADGSFDVVTCSLGLSHFGDVSAVLREVRRVLRRGGRFVASAWERTTASRAGRAVAEELRRRAGGDIHSLGRWLDETSWADRGRGSDLLRRAGLERVRATSEEMSGFYASPRAAVEFMLAFPNYGETLDALEPGARAAVRAAAAGAVRSSADLAWWAVVNFYEAIRGR